MLHQDSNLNSNSQSVVCYHYTIEQFNNFIIQTKCFQTGFEPITTCSTQIVLPIKLLKLVIILFGKIMLLQGVLLKGIKLPLYNIQRYTAEKEGFEPPRHF